MRLGTFDLVNDLKRSTTFKLCTSYMCAIFVDKLYPFSAPFAT